MDFRPVINGHYLHLYVVLKSWRLWDDIPGEVCGTILVRHVDDMHFVWFSIRDFSHHESQNPAQSLATNEIRRRVVRKPYKMYFLAYFTLQDMLVMLNILRKVENHENHVRWIYIKTVLNMGDSRKYARINITVSCVRPRPVSGAPVSGAPVITHHSCPGWSNLAYDSA